MTKNSLQTKIKDFRPSGVDWLGNIPAGWNLVPTRSLFKTKKQLVGAEAEKHLLLGLTLSGVKPRDLSLGGKNPADYDSYQIFEPGELVMCLFDYDVTPRTVGYLKQKGMMTGAYTRLIPRINLDARYYYYLFLYFDEKKELLHLCTGLRNSISKYVFWSLQNPQPPVETQKRIADFLDEKTRVIDDLVAKKEELIELLREKRAALITRAVTKGLNPNVKLKPSGVDWLGDIPEGWGVKPLKFLFSYLAGGIWGEEERFDENDMICIRVADFDFLSFTTHSDEYTRRNLPEIKKSFLLDERSVLLEKSGGGDQSPVGRAVRYVGSEKATCSNFIQKLEVNSGFNTEFVVYLLATLYFLGVTKKAIKQTTGIQNLDLAYFFRTPVFYPPTDEQKKIAQYINTELEKIVDTLEKIESQIDKLKEYRSSLIYHAVTGKIKV